MKLIVSIESPDQIAASLDKRLTLYMQENYK